MKVLFIVPYPRNEAASQRFRFEQYMDVLGAGGIETAFNSFWDERTWKILYLRGHILLKVLGFMKGWLRRFFLVFKLHRYHYIFLHREAAPVGPPVVEWLIAKVFRKKIIYDFDDAIWLPNTSDSNSFASMLKWHGKVKSICRWSYKVSCGNEYLASFASTYCPRAEVIPTTVDTDYYIRKENKKDSGKTIIGWTGSQSTNYYLKLLEPAFKELSVKYNFELRIISNQPPALDIPFTFIKWNRSTEVEDLLPIDIGIMPLPDDEWAKGKCGFKLIQYMALNIASVASPVGVNTKIIQPMKTGLLASTTDEWYIALEKLISDASLRSQLGANGRNEIVEQYSKKSQSRNYLLLFR
jgi:glycosyltransferase involved in cell wall biosynthesis